MQKHPISALAIYSIFTNLFSKYDIIYVSRKWFRDFVFCKMTESSFPVQLVCHLVGQPHRASHRKSIVI